MADFRLEGPRTTIAPNIEERIFAMADGAVIEVRRNKMPCYSNFHTWAALRKFEIKEEAEGAAIAMCGTTRPFGNCLFMADECAVALM
jgi:hypothetical protein